ncbi:hypothetical protein F1D05_35845 [Kribbella qitaiheensis]|uniref:Uncharacterized protein n=1 Tax=Kribbella qitaiheensis TaxID=1544730 RepID=A0A7G6X7T1_9ACTN|nr:hypothetical protein [Kribbella qitaiheensis]QNE22296.1 hypothetical protein F1D05_35845 [Kribbella qitaiheensis]
MRPITAPDDAQAGFELVTSTDAEDPPDVDELNGVRQLRQDLLAGLPALFEQRAADSPGGRLTSPFWQRIDRFERRSASGGAPAQDALNEHLDHVYRILGSAESVDNPSDFRLMAIEATVGLPVWAATVRWQSSASWMSGIGAILSIAAPAAVRRGRAGAERRRKIRRIFHAFGRAIDL